VDCYLSSLRLADFSLVTRPFNSAAGLSKPFRPPGFVERSAVGISNQSDISYEKLPSHVESIRKPVIPPSPPVTPSEDVNSDHDQEGKKKSVRS
jgi:hypothetical protein